jgi:two-component system OmpR family sensor kinase
VKRPTSTLPARWRIIAWMVVTMTVGLAVVVVTVRGVLLTSVANGANHDVVQEIDEFRSFAAQGLDPETAQPFTSSARMLEVYLTRQQPSASELLLGVFPSTGHVYEQRGGLVPPSPAYDPLQDSEFLADIERTNAGRHDSVVGTIRWGKVDLEGPGGVEGSLLVLYFTQAEEGAVQETVTTLVLVSLGTLLVMVALAFIAASQILRPLRLLQRTAEEITERRLTTRIPVSGTDDVSQLARTFNAMLARLETAFDTQQQFVDDAGHELRTPITAIRGHLELLHTRTPAEQAQTITLLTGELDRMGRIVNDLLALARADQPDFVQSVETDIGELTLDIESVAQGLADRRWVLSNIADGVAAVDPQRMTQAVLQLASNAVQHTRTGDEIRISSDFVSIAGTSMVRFTVADTGPGVHPDDRDRIFERFTRSGKDSSVSGAGLGLAIVAAIARAHGGHIHVGGEYGAGATFTLAVPVAGTGATNKLPAALEPA